MTTSVRDTSLESWKQIALKLPAAQQRVIVTIGNAHRPLCDFEIGKILHWPINCVTPRRKELVDRGVLVDTGKRKSPTGSKAHFWEIAGKTTLF